MQSKKKHIHFIGIAGTLIAPLAVAMKKQGWRVTGSDLAFYPPMSTFLEDNKIQIIPGFKPDKFERIGLPDLAVLMSFLTQNNPEFKYLKKHKVEVIGLGQLMQKYFIKENSIVVTGNYGKTTITSLLGWILQVAGFDPSVFAGGYLHNFKGGVKIGKSSWSVSEGDEFKVWNISKNYLFRRKPRMLYQRPKFVILTDATWDHYDQYPTKDEYINTYVRSVKQVSKSGYVIGNAQGKNVKQILKYAKANFVSLKLEKLSKLTSTQKRNFSAMADKLRKLSVTDIKFTKQGSEFNLLGEKYYTPMLGQIGVLNTSLAIALAVKIGIDARYIKNALKTYMGVKRRQEERYTSPSYNKRGQGGVKIIDDFAHSPVKLMGMVDLLKLHFPNDKIVLIYQPGSKDKKALSKYPAKTFDGVDFIILPRVSSTGQEARHFNALLGHKLRKTKLKNKVRYISNDEELVNFVHKKIKQLNKNKKHVIVLFAAQKGFRGMIEELIRQLS